MTLKHLSEKGKGTDGLVRGYTIMVLAQLSFFLGAVLSYVSFNVTASQMLTEGTRGIPQIPKSVSHWVPFVFILIKVGDILEKMSRKQADRDRLESFDIVKEGHCKAPCSLGGLTDICRELEGIMTGVRQTCDLMRFTTNSVRIVS